ncbi:unnamed protein product [Ostreobium quekettii]|uniref:Coenzyme Q-binding protein COQ10 START domain-containing protein n=1 Tax=Ostreobium quekettii TaxID=121088 RepID=A0A8S1IYT0_9CHLO|nr:unnamed protein product [Ostreobium quekettii]
MPYALAPSKLATCVVKESVPRRNRGTARQDLWQRSFLAGRPVVPSFRACRGVEVHKSIQNGAKWMAAQWLDNRAELKVPVSLAECWELWQDRTLMPQWMPWITSVEVLDEDPALSRWTLSTEQFNRTWEFSWLARNLTAIPYQKIHWRSEPGPSTGLIDLSNRGQVRFYPGPDNSCSVSMTVSYEVPDVLVPFANVSS